MRKILVLGAGLVCRPLVSYLLERTEHQVVVADVDLSRAESVVGQRARGIAVKVAVENREALHSLIQNSDLVISMLPASLHPVVAWACVKLGKNMITASYVSPAMRELDEEAKSKGVILLNELGLDPGIDHMEAQRIINQVHEVNGKVRSFISYCGGLPAPEFNNNPFGYKFSWSPKGVLMAGKNQARFLKDGKVITIQPEELFSTPEVIKISGLGEFDGYPNRDSVSYQEIYNIPEAGTVLRGTLRYQGWCETLKAIYVLGLLNEEIMDWSGKTYEEFTRIVVGCSRQEELKSYIARKLGVGQESAIISRLEWLGLFSNHRLPVEQASPIDVMTAIMSDRMKYEKGEKDMIVLQHEFVVEYPKRNVEKIVSTLIDYGEPDGDSAMSRTVGYPVAIAAKLVAERRIILAGVQIPVHPEIYTPILEELENLGIRFSESIRSL